MTLLRSILAALLLLTTPAPKLAINGTKTFKVTFEAGAVWANVSYTSRNEHTADGPRVIYDNYELGEKSNFIEDTIDVDCPLDSGCDWDMKVSIGYPHESDTVPGVTNVDYIDSNVITFHK